MSRMTLIKGISSMTTFQKQNIWKKKTTTTTTKNNHTHGILMKMKNEFCIVKIKRQQSTCLHITRIRELISQWIFLSVCCWFTTTCIHNVVLSNTQYTKICVCECVCRIAFSVFDTCFFFLFLLLFCILVHFCSVFPHNRFMYLRVMTDLLTSISYVLYGISRCNNQR